MFTLIDWIVLFAYLLFSLAIGLWVSRGNKNLKEYMFGGGAMPWVAVGISLIATSVSATTFLGAPADVYGDDMTFLMFQIGALLSIIVVGFVFIPRFRSAGINSAYELFERRFGSLAVRRLAALFYCLHLLLRTGILLYAPSLVLAQILHVDLRVAIVVSAAVAIFYTWFGGIKAVIWTDVMQFCVFFGGGALVLILISNAVGGFGEMAAMASEAGKTRWWNPSIDISDARTLVSAGFAYAILEIAIRGCDQQFVQRYLSCKDVKAANRSSILSMVLGCAVSILFYWVGAALFVYYKVTCVSSLPEGIGQNDVFPYFIVNGLPIGVTGLIVAAICAAAMSSLSGAINSLSNTSEHDFLGWKEDEGIGGLKRAKIWTVVWGVLGVFFALFAATQQGSLLKNALFFTGLFTGPLLGMFILAFFVKNLRPWMVIVAVLCGMASLVLIQGIPAFGVPALLGGIFSWPWMPFISMTTTIVVAVALKLVCTPFLKTRKA
ncbi:sodium:solute symporter [Fibrobacter sp. UWP2]|uniref:sodium:solute symporter n=1 Tax=Fibrobacter sp. UWP2 TaxID=1896216 RepID=UPI000919E9C8|nr:sodium:solute symporter [Fibrobacter sp. UWP2]SHJ21643.1 solute:Na+ symporter, SSS family [Fibrobacter sp. UWP2]